MKPINPLYRAVLGQCERWADLDEKAWDDLAKGAGREDLEGLLYQGALAAEADMPAGVREHLSAIYRETAVHNMVALQTAGEVLERATRTGLEALVMPGAALLPHYPDLGCRPMDDVDILVRPGRLHEMRNFLRKQGFSSPPRHPDLWERRGVVFDLHEDLLNCSRIGARRYAGCLDGREVWRDSREHIVEGWSLTTMGREDALLYTAVHALRHSFRRMTWFFDLYFLLRTTDWSLVREKAQRYCVQRPLVYGLRFLREHLQLELPDCTGAWMEGTTVCWGEEYLLQRAWQDRLEREWGDLLWSFNIPDMSQRCRFLIETFFPSPSVLLQVFPYLPRALYPLAYALRIGQLTLKGGKYMAGLVWRG